VGITGTKSQFNTAVTDGNFLYVGDTLKLPTYTVGASNADYTTIQGAIDAATSG
jgi:hypothetical protein